MKVYIIVDTNTGNAMTINGTFKPLDEIHINNLRASTTLESINNELELVKSEKEVVENRISWLEDYINNVCDTVEHYIKYHGNDHNPRKIQDEFRKSSRRLTKLSLASAKRKLAKINLINPVVKELVLTVK